jgi:hypothetical protein
LYFKQGNVGLQAELSGSFLWGGGGGEGGFDFFVIRRDSHKAILKQYKENIRVDQNTVFVSEVTLPAM